MNPHHLLPLSVQIVLWMILIVSVSLVSLFGIVYTSLIDLWVLKLIFDLSLSVDCSPGGAELSEKPWAPAFMLSFAGGRFALHSWTSILVLYTPCQLSLAASRSIGIVLSAVYEIHLKKIIFPWHLSNLRLHNCSFCRGCLFRFFALVL